jgi:hypothetical protein
MQRRCPDEEHIGKEKLGGIVTQIVDVRAEARTLQLRNRFRALQGLNQENMAIDQPASAKKPALLLERDQIAKNSVFFCRDSHIYVDIYRVI